MSGKWHHESDERRAARLGQRCPRQPVTEPNKVQGRCGHDMLQVGFCQPYVARPTQPATAHALGDGSLNPGPLGILLPIGDQDKTGAELRILADRTARLLSWQPWMRKLSLRRTGFTCGFGCRWYPGLERDSRNQDGMAVAA